MVEKSLPGAGLELGNARSVASTLPTELPGLQQINITTVFASLKGRICSNPIWKQILALQF